MKPKKPIDLDRARDDSRKFHGLPPHNVPSNYSWGDGYFAEDIARRYGMSLKELEDLVKPL